MSHDRDATAPYAHHQLQRLFAPRSVAIVGASPTAGSFGHRTLLGLRQAGFDGRVHLVNERHAQIEGIACAARLTDLPEAPDCVIVAVQQRHVEAVIEEAAAMRAGGAIVYASGYVETGRDDAAAAQHRLATLARQRGMPLLGPNCIGIASGPARFAAAMVDVPPLSTAPHGGIGIVSQSGAFGLGLAQATQLGVPVSHVLTAGNSSDVDIGDEIAYLAAEPSCSAIACLFEGSAQPQRILRAAQMARDAGKPLLVCKIAVGAEGAQAAMSHTGSLAGSHRAYRTALERAGAIWLEDPEALVEAAAFFVKARKPGAPGVAVVSTSGGAAILSADKAEAHGVPLPQPMPDTRAVLQREIPEFGSPRNPCDLTAQAGQKPESITACFDALYADPQYATVVLCVPYAHPLMGPRLQAFADAAARHGKPGVIVWMTNWIDGPGSRLMEDSPHVALFRSTDRCFAALSAWLKPAHPEAANPADSAPVTPESIRAATRQSLLDAPTRVIAERQAKALLRGYGVPVVEEVLAGSLAEALAGAERLGYPVVLKVESPDVPHKSDAGLVALGLRSPREVQDAYALLLERSARIEPPPRILGVLVQPMVGSGVELMVGATVDPLFGPLIVAGLGGVLVEVLKDTAMGLPPLARADARRMLLGLKGAPLLQGYRGSTPVDLDHLADVICAVARFADEHRDLVQEIDVNPLICSGDRITAVDALIVLRHDATSPAR